MKYIILLIFIYIQAIYAQNENHDNEMISGEAAKKIAEKTGFTHMTNFSKDVAKEMLLNDFHSPASQKIRDFKFFNNSFLYVTFRPKSLKNEK